MTEGVKIADAIIAGIGADDTANEQMAAILKNLDDAGFVIVSKSIWFRPDDDKPSDVQ